MTAPSRPTLHRMALLHLLAGALLGIGLVGAFLLRKPDFADHRVFEFRKIAITIACDWGVLGAVGGLIGGAAAGLRTDDRATAAPGMRFWMVALGAGGALTLGALALRTMPTSGGGQASGVLTLLVVGWLAGVLLGAVGSAFAETVSPIVTAALRKATRGLPESSAKAIGAILGGAMWAIVWGVLVAFLAAFTVGVVLLSVRTGDVGPALAVGGTCGCVFFALRFVLFSRRGGRT